MASCKNDIDDQIKIDDFAFVESITQNNIDCNLAPADGYVEVTGNGQLRDNDITHVPADGYIEVYRVTDMYKLTMTLTCHLRMDMSR